MTSFLFSFIRVHDRVCDSVVAAPFTPVISTVQCACGRLAVTSHLCIDGLPVSPLADIISTVEFNYSGELLATGDKGGRVVIFQHEQEVRLCIVVVLLYYIHAVC